MFYLLVDKSVRSIEFWPKEVITWHDTCKQSWGQQTKQRYKNQDKKRFKWLWAWYSLCFITADY